MEVITPVTGYFLCSRDLMSVLRIFTRSPTFIGIQFRFVVVVVVQRPSGDTHRLASLGLYKGMLQALLIHGKYNRIYMVPSVLFLRMA